MAGAETVAYLDVDDTIRATHGYAKQGTGYGYSGVRGLNAQLATLSTPTAAPVIAATRLRRGSAASAHRDDPINRIADRLGFDDASNFVKYFTQRAGITPSAFRRQFQAS